MSPAFFRLFSLIRNTMGRLQHIEELPARSGQFHEVTPKLPEAVQRILRSKGIEQLYSHQATAIQLARQQQDLVVVSGTASGKTLCYNVPILETCLGDPEARAVSVSDQSAGPRPDEGVIGLLATDDDVAARSSRASSTATRPPRSDDASRPKPTWCFPIRTCCTRRYSRIIPKWSTFLRRTQICCA